MSDQESSEDQVIMQESQQSDNQSIEEEEEEEDEEEEENQEQDEEEGLSNSQSPAEVEASITQLESPMQSGNYIKKEESIVGEQSSPHEKRLSFGESNERESFYKEGQPFYKKQRITSENEEQMDEVITEVNPDIQQTKLFQRFIKLEEEKKKLITKDQSPSLLKNQKNKQPQKLLQQQGIANQPKIITYDNIKEADESEAQSNKENNKKSEYQKESYFQPFKPAQNQLSREQPSPSDKRATQFTYEEDEVQEESSQTKQDFFASKLTRDSSLTEEKELQGYSTHVGFTNGPGQGQNPDMVFYQQQQQFLYQQQIPQASPYGYPQMQQMKGMQQPYVYPPQQFYPFPAAYLIPPQYYQQFQQSQASTVQTQGKQNSIVPQQNSQQQQDIKKQYEEQIQEEQKQIQKLKQNLDEVNDKFLNYKFDKENLLISLQEQIQELKEKSSSKPNVENKGEEKVNQGKEQEFLDKIEELQKKFSNIKVERDMLDKKIKQNEQEQIKVARGDKDVRKQIQEQTQKIKELEESVKNQDENLQSFKVGNEKLKQDLNALRLKEEKQNNNILEANYKIKQYEDDLLQVRKKLKDEQQQSKQYQIEQESMRRELQKAQDTQRSLENQVEVLKSQNFEIKQDVADGKRKEQQNSQIIDQLSRDLNILKTQLQNAKADPQTKNLYESKDKSSNWQSAYQSQNYSQHQDSSVLLESPIRQGNYNNLKESTNQSRAQSSYLGVSQSGFGQKTQNQHQQSTQSPIPHKQIQLSKNSQASDYDSLFGSKPGRTKQQQQIQESMQSSYSKGQTIESSQDYYQSKNKKNLQESPGVKKSTATYDLDYSHSESQEISQLTSFSSKQSKQSQNQSGKKNQKGVVKSQPQMQQNEQEEGLVFPSENKNLRNKSQQINHLETQLMQLSLEKDKISPEIAAKVVQQYLLPMFDSFERSLKDQNRVFELGTQEKYFQNQLKEFHYSELNTDADSRPKSKNGTNQKIQQHSYGQAQRATTVYDELKLSDRLMQELKATRLELSDIQQKLQDSEQSNYTHQYKAKEYQLKNTDMEIKLRIFKEKYETIYKEHMQSQKTLNHLKEQITLVQKQLKESDKSRSFLSEQNNNLNKNIENKEIQINQLRNNNEVLRMEKEIITEQFTVLIQNFGQLPIRCFMDISVKAQFNYMLHLLTSFVKLYEGVINQLDITKRENIVFEDNMKYIIRIRKELASEYEKQQVEVQKKMQILIKELESVTEERDNYMQKWQTFEKNNKNLNATVEKLRQKIQNYRKRNLKFLDTNLKVCKNCNCEYFENENFNWSCRLHTSTYGEHMWWCCGKQASDAPGCRVQKHESKDEDDNDEDDQEEQDPNELIKNKMKYYKCPQCKGFGHKTQDCPKEPNIRIGCEIADELLRIQNLKKQKKQNNFNINNEQSKEDQFGDMELVLNKFKDFMKTQSSVNSDSSEQIQYEDLFEDYESSSLKQNTEEKENQIARQLSLPSAGITEQQQTEKSEHFQNHDYWRQVKAFEDIEQDQLDVFQMNTDLLQIQVSKHPEQEYNKELQKKKTNFSEEIQESQDSETSEELISLEQSSRNSQDSDLTFKSEKKIREQKQPKIKIAMFQKESVHLQNNIYQNVLSATLLKSRKSRLVAKHKRGSVDDNAYMLSSPEKSVKNQNGHRVSVSPQVNVESLTTQNDFSDQEQNNASNANELTCEKSLDFQAETFKKKSKKPQRSENNNIERLQIQSHEQEIKLLSNQNDQNKETQSKNILQQSPTKDIKQQSFKSSNDLDIVNEEPDESDRLLDYGQN